jgi:hypothetical protein
MMTLAFFLPLCVVHAATEERYRPPALSFSKFEKRGFLARLKSPVLLLPHDARRCSLEHIPKSLASVVQVWSWRWHAVGLCGTASLMHGSS